MLEFVDPATGIARFSFKQVGSTNDEAFALSQEKGGDLFFVTAESQNGGRGRLGRRWISEPGNLYASLFCRNPGKPDICSTLSFVAAVALREAVEDCLGEGKAHPCTLKWPNDVLWSGAKISGILLEMRRYGDISEVVIGIGVNCAHAPSNTPYAVTSFQDEGFDLKPEPLFSALHHRLLDNLNLWNRGAGFDKIRRKWIKNAHRLGEEIVLKGQNKERRGLFRGVDSMGQLIFAQAGKSDEIVSAGDVFFSPQPGND